MIAVLGLCILAVSALLVCAAHCLHRYRAAGLLSIDGGLAFGAG
jgi:hypothetical protein